MKKLISFCLAAALLVTGAFAASFPDLENHWCDTYVKTLVQRNVINGMPDGKYHPDDEVTRGSIAKMLVTALESLGVTLDSSGEPIADTVGTWAEGSITALASAGILVEAEYPNGFEQGESMTRLETIKAVVRAYEFVIGQGAVADVPDFLDISEISDTDLPYVALGVELGIINGIEKPNGFEFQPSGSIQRSTAAAMVARFVTAVETAQAAQPEVVSVVDSNGPEIYTTDGQLIKWLIAPGASVGEGIKIDNTKEYDDNGYLRLINSKRESVRMIDVDGNVVLDAVEIQNSGNGFYAVYLTEPDANGKRLGGIMNSSLEWHVQPIECCDIGSVWGNTNWYRVGDENGENTYYDLNGNVIPNEEIDKFRNEYYAESQAAVKVLQEKFSGFDRNKDNWWTQPLIPVSLYDEDLIFDLNMTIGAFRERVELAASGFPSMSVLYFEDAAGLATPEGELVVPLEYERSHWAGGDYIYATKPLDAMSMDVEFPIDYIDYVCDIYDGEGNIIYTYYSILSCHGRPERAAAEGYNTLKWVEYSEGLVACTDTVGCGYMDVKGNIIIPCVFDDVDAFFNGRAIVSYNGQLGIIEIPEL